MLSKICRARRHVEELRLGLLSPSPEDVLRCLPGLESAIDCLRSVEEELRQSPNSEGRSSLAIRAELNQFKKDLNMIGRLIAHGAALHEGWARILGAAAGGYLQSGDAAPLSGSGGTLFLQG